jgi:fructuronate reductase/mannitol 2-dehydrogenase
VRAGGSDPRPLLAIESIFGDLGADTSFVAELERSIVQLERDGVRATLQVQLSSSERLRR